MLKWTFPQATKLVLGSLPAVRCDLGDLDCNLQLVKTSENMPKALKA